VNWSISPPGNQFARRPFSRGDHLLISGQSRYPIAPASDWCGKGPFPVSTTIRIDVPLRGFYSRQPERRWRTDHGGRSLGDVLSSFTMRPPTLAGEMRTPPNPGFFPIPTGFGHPPAWRASVDTGAHPAERTPRNSPRTPSADGMETDGRTLLEYALGTSDIDPTSGPGALTPGFDALGNFTLTFPRTSVPTTSPWLSRPLRTYSPGLKPG